MCVYTYTHTVLLFWGGYCTTLKCGQLKQSHDCLAATTPWGSMHDPRYESGNQIVLGSCPDCFSIMSIMCKNSLSAFSLWLDSWRWRERERERVFPAIVWPQGGLFCW